MPAHFASDELYRVVYDRHNTPDIEPSYEVLKQYEYRLLYSFYELHIESVQPYAAMMVYYVPRIYKILAAKTWPRDVDSDDPGLACYDEPPVCCD
jgi:hypothetical protein